jgi:hypothetical protein
MIYSGGILGLGSAFYLFLSASSVVFACGAIARM